MWLHGSLCYSTNHIKGIESFMPTPADSIGLPNRKELKKP